MPHEIAATELKEFLGTRPVIKVHGTRREMSAAVDTGTGLQPGEEFFTPTLPGLF
jgi:hypothetical protein